MDTLEIISRLDALLTEERVAIARLDGARVAAFAAEKTALAHALEKTSAADRARCGRPLKRLVQNLKANGVLLAQGRAILSDFLLGPGHSLARGGLLSLRPIASGAPRHLSVRG